jgi:threonine dehydrogenase-like Zn-dependent dehydrogenase
MGVITEAGPGVVLLKKGDRVVMPFNVADGRCRNCEEGNTAFCTGVNPVGTEPRRSTVVIFADYPLGLCWRSAFVSLIWRSVVLLTATQGAYGYVAMGPYDGGQVSSGLESKSVWI